MLIRECAPLCLAQDSGWGGVYRGWAWIAATKTMLGFHRGVKATGRWPPAALPAAGSEATGSDLQQLRGAMLPPD